MVYLSMANIKKSPRILIYSPIYYPDIGGPAVQAKFLTEMLYENGFEVFVIKYNNLVDFNPNINVISLNWNSNPHIFTRIFRWFIGPLISLFYLIQLRPSLVLINSVFWNGMFMGLFCRFLCIPTILKFTGDWVFESTSNLKKTTVELEKIYRSNLINSLLFQVERFFVRQFTVVWVISEFRKQNVLNLTRKPKIWLQNNFHDLPSSSISSSSRFKDPLIFVTTARLIPHKRIDVIISTLSRFPKGYKFIVIGEGSELIALKQQAIRLNLSQNIFFVGKITDELLYEILTLSSAFISWSAEEGAPNSFIEALNFGLPIISANVGGIPEMFARDSKAAQLLEPEDTDALYYCIERLILTPEYLLEMSIHATNDALKFSKANNQQKFLSLISGLVVNSNF
jgi:glycosyltransferase involved in cell wall biosynthesis